MDEHAKDIGVLAAKRFELSRTSISRYMQRLAQDGLIEATGQTNARTYKLKPLSSIAYEIPVTKDMLEIDIWNKFVEPAVIGTPQNIRNICLYGFAEMFNNVIDHSGSPVARILYAQDYAKIEMMVADDGIGIFQKIQQDFHLEDARTALLELAKGKLTSDKEKHSGEGIFFTSRMFNEFSIRSGNLYYRRTRKDDWGWLIETDNIVQPRLGTCIHMIINTDATWTTKEVFDRFTVDDDGAPLFAKTHVPISLGKYGQEQLVSRSQAKRILARFEKFREIFLDFQGVDFIGQPFADEMFRVFHTQHPDVRIIMLNANDAIDKMIAHVRGQGGGLVRDEPTLFEAAAQKRDKQSN